MIDVGVNEHGGITIVHDVRALDQMTRLHVVLKTGMLTLANDEDSFPLGRLKPELREMITTDMPARIVRMAGWGMEDIRGLEAIYS